MLNPNSMCLSKRCYCVQGSRTICIYLTNPLTKHINYIICNIQDVYQKLIYLCKYLGGGVQLSKRSVWNYINSKYVLIKDMTLILFRFIFSCVCTLCPLIRKLFIHATVMGFHFKVSDVNCMP